MKEAWRVKKIITTGSLLAVLAGCGGGGSDALPTPPATSAVPPSASASVAGFIGYLMQLVVAPADTLEPVDVSKVTPPVSDNTEPSPVD